MMRRGEGFGKVSFHRVVAVDPKHVQGQSFQSTSKTGPAPLRQGGVAVNILSTAFGVFRRLVSKRFRRREGLPARLPLTISSTIQVLPGQAPVMKSAAVLALRGQVVSRP